MSELNFDDEATRKEGDELEAIVDDMVYRLKQTREGSAAHKMIVRQLVGIRDGSQMGAIVMEEFTYRDLDLPPRQRPSSSPRTSPGKLAPAKPPTP